ncbi:MAG: MepB domain containing protein [Gammaproteobacteria bacterium RIFCSPLOWO2_02_FULL_42_14]|nr:MAG: MepB domain containing protein [Gammaproteobacteria bacterium RIFCSPHIGHO2_02_FULL_42_43]OGT29298.1 MAG: MepB domain containing protein [Gammaproteobacteria bacterium RIFCSPHIGHO2_01_FULL_42_8]OGT50761.1 MAG: MepB domain containing protein [Gammaproteobacteria bacterium RIFCSPHIGHO2_12_FULL_41_25]OGT61746.1 MAG: MepB domain containing protein [Gammaproteobacteria bacterium RIFCSPLOWO2_02_FULL_42_14]OGT85490.1 MAG: MepB domain containing protein [Gammaproteobacteria bacterium RIFCSPLOWO2
MNIQRESFSDPFFDNQNSWSSDNNIHKDLIATKKYIYDPCKMIISTPMMESESAEYGAFTFKLNDFDIRFRVAKITPTKTGQFVTLWKRSAGEPIQPFDASDPVDFVVICVRNDKNFGQFVFPSPVLCEKDILSVDSKGGKRAIRVYPPWDETTSKQAKKTQEWQMKYFLEIPENRSVDCVRAKFLYSGH